MRSLLTSILRTFPKVENGWGAVIFIGGDRNKAAYFQGRLPHEILHEISRQLNCNSAFIYLLEAWVAVLAVLEPWFGPCCVQTRPPAGSRQAAEFHENLPEHRHRLNAQGGLWLVFAHDCFGCVTVGRFGFNSAWSWFAVGCGLRVGVILVFQFVRLGFRC